MSQPRKPDLTDPSTPAATLSGERVPTPDPYTSEDSGTTYVTNFGTSDGACRPTHSAGGRVESGEPQARSDGR